jgi:protein TonB
MPVYPEIARKTAMQGKVMVRVILDEKGKVISAKGINGPKLLQGAGEDAARKSKFNPTLSENQPVKATGIIVYNFVY